MRPSPTATSLPYVEQDCTIEHNGQTFEAGGAVVTNDIIYGYVVDRTIRNWHGDTILLRITRTNTTRMWQGARLTAVWAVDADGQRWFGKYGSDWADLIRMRPLKAQS